MVPWRQVYLRATVATLGRFARYQIISKTMLPMYAIDPVWAKIPKKKRRPDNETMIIVEPFFRDLNRKTLATQVSWWGVPNHAMIPLNGAARIIWDAFIQVAGAPPVVPEMKPSWTSRRAGEKQRPRASLYAHRD